MYDFLCRPLHFEGHKLYRPIMELLRTLNMRIEKNSILVEKVLKDSTFWHRKCELVITWWYRQ